MKKIAITGSSGFIGKQLIPALQNTGHKIIEISRCKGLDICDWATVKNLPKCEVIVHLAAKTFVPDSFENPQEFYLTNIQATINSLELARKWNAKVIYMSSYFYGPPKYLPVDEQHPLNPHNPYAQTKLLAEQLCAAYERDFGVSCIAFRLFNVYGPGQTGSFLIPEILDKIKTGKLILKDPRPKRDYIHILDVVRAIEISLTYQQTGFEVFNIGMGKSYSVEEVVNTVLKFSPISFEIEYTHEYRKGEVLDSVASTQLISKKLGFVPTIDLDKGISLLFK